MAGETALSAYSIQGLYILQDNNGWVAGNTPNTCNIGGDTGLVLGTSFMYFDIFVFLHHDATTLRTEDFKGWVFYQDGSTLLKTKASTGQAMQRSFTARVQATNTQQANFEKFFDYNQATTRAEIYLVRQLASTTFKQFSYNATNYYYTPITMTGYHLEESANPGNLQLINIDFQQANRIKTS